MGGGGITPDVKIDPIKSNKFQDSMIQRYVFFNFAKRYVITHHPTEEKFEVDDAIMNDFRKFMDEEKVTYSEADLLENSDWVKANIKSEIFVDAFGQQEGLKVRAETDPQVVKALELLAASQDVGRERTQGGCGANRASDPEPVVGW
jgi:carboxyl-terminal processing protease